MARKKKDNVEDYPVIKSNVAGIDIGSTFHVVAIPANKCENPVRQFSSLSSGLAEIVEFFKEYGITEAAMEATGVYWEPLFNLLEANGIKAVLLNPRSLSGILKSDVHDAKNIQKVYSHGFGQTCYVPDAETIELRNLVRHKENLIQTGAQHTNRMIKSLRLMNINLDMAVGDVQGETGMRIISVIVAGEKDPFKLAELRDPRCKKKVKEIAAHLDGVFKKSHIDTLASNLSIYNHLMGEVRIIDEKILQYMREMDTSPNYVLPANQSEPPDFNEYTKGTTKTTSERRIGTLFSQEAHRILGVDLRLVEGIGPGTILTFLSEIGRNITAFDTPGKLASYLGLCPGCKISGGKVLSKKTKKVIHRLAKALRMSANSLWRSKSWLGAFYRKMRSRQGTPKAITSTAHKLMRLIYGLIKNGKQYVTSMVEVEEAKKKMYQVKKVLMQAQELGLVLVSSESSCQVEA